MGTRSFGGTLLFGLLAGASYPFHAALATPLLGAAGALWLWVGGVGLAWAALLGRSLRERLGHVLLAGAVLTPTLALAHSVEGLLAGAALAMATVRLVRLGPARPARAFALELGLAVGTFALLHAVAEPGRLAIALSTWAWFLVQSLWFLLVDVTDDGGATLAVDPFDLAHERANAILEEEPN